MPSPPVPDPKREVRVGLVLYGGVSLAVYMSGVVQEFWRLVRASRGTEANAYAALLTAAEVTATVDVVSGTSAGGINGVLLAKALATGADLGVLHDFWIERADMSDLMRKPSDLTPRSLLRGDYFEQQLADALAEMDRLGTGEPLVEAMDLFVSGTRLRGMVRTFIDDLGQTVQTREYRKSFHLKYRRKGYNAVDPTLGYDQNDFTSSANRMLVEISRATSAFPGAFEPQLIDKRDDNRVLFDEGDPDSAFYSDGGVLHNKPFTETIGAIFARMADRPVSRWLVSLEPDPEGFGPQASPGPDPEVTEVVGKTSSGIPRYQSIAADLDQVRAHNERAGWVNDLLGGIDRLVDHRFRAQVDTASDAEYRAFLEGQVLYSAYQSLKVETLVDDLSGRLAHAAGLGDDDKPFIQNGVRSFAGIRTPVIPGDAALEPFLNSFDDGYRIRRLVYLIQALSDLVGSLPAEEQAALRDRHRELWAQFDKTRGLAWDLFQGDTPQAETVRGLHGQGGSALAAAVTAVLGDLEAALTSAMAAIRAETAATCDAIDAEVGRLKGLNLPEAAVPAQTFRKTLERYEVRDMLVLPVQRVSDLGERGHVGFVRISPAAATYVHKSPADKLAGDTVGHFGGFLSRDWRRNDVMWGRMDAAEVIVRLVLEKAPREVVEPHVHAIQEEISRTELADAWQDHPNLNYKDHLERAWTIGGQGPADLPPQQTVPLAVRAASVMRNMLRRLEQVGTGGGFRAAFHALGSALGFALGAIKWPVMAIWGKDWYVRRFATLLLLFLFGWGVLLFALGAFGVIPLTARVILWAAGFLTPVLAWVVVALVAGFARRARSRPKAPRRQP